MRVVLGCEPASAVNAEPGAVEGEACAHVGVLSAAGAQLPALHRLLRQPAQRQEADVAVPAVQGGAGHKLLQEQVHFAGRSPRVLEYFLSR